MYGSLFWLEFHAVSGQQALTQFFRISIMPFDQPGGADCVSRSAPYAPLSFSTALRLCTVLTAFSALLAGVGLAARTLAANPSSASGPW